MGNDSILEIVWRQRRLIAATTALCLVLAGVYLLVATRYYSATARLYVQMAGPEVIVGPQRSSQESETFLFTQRELVSSTPVIAMTLGTPGIREMKTFSGEENTFAFFKKSLTVDVGKKDEMLSLAFDTRYREEAEPIVAAWIDAYKNYQSKQRQSNTAAVMTILQTEREKRQGELTAKQEKLQAFRAEHGMISGADDRTNAVKRQLEDHLTQLTQANRDRIDADIAWKDVSQSIFANPQRKLAFEKYRESAGFSSPSANDDAQLRTEMLQWQAHLHTIREKYLPSHPSVKNVQARIDQLNLQYAAAVFRRLEMATQREANMQASFDKQQKIAIENNKQAVQDTQLAADVARLQKMTDDLDEQIKNATLAQGGGAPHIEVIDPPLVSKSTTRPYYLRTLALALLGGIVLGCGGACVRDWYDFRFRTPDEIKASLGVSLLGLIPSVADENSPIARGQKIHIDPQSDVAEAYRSLRTAIYFGTQEGSARTILLTSPERGDGKTTSASNLAISIAQASRRTLLIDADMRAPMQDLIFGINGKIGLATVLQGKSTAEAAICHTGIENLDLMPAGVCGRNPSELLNNQKFIDMLEELSSKYDHVVIDSPPLLPVADARIIAASVDATLLVLRVGKSHRKLSEVSIDGLLAVGARLLGVVVNDVQRNSGQYYGSYGYGYAENGREREALEATSARDRKDEYAATGRENALPVRNRLTG